VGNDNLKAVRNSEVHFSFFLFHSFREGEKHSRQEGRGKKEKGRRNT
jgi:hypothetical protein